MVSESPKPRIETTTTVAGPSDRTPLPVTLVPEGTAARPRRLEIAAGRWRIGAGADADLILEDPTVSRRHAEVELVSDGLKVTDLNSRNGTYYLGVRIEQVVVPIGMSLRFGNTEVRVELSESALSAGSTGPEGYDELIGSSPRMRRLFASLRRLEGSLIGVLLEGESGTGKELIARAIHRASPVAAGPLIAVNCGGLARELIHSELFGHKRGAFTGAFEQRRGAFELADGGTLLLDEIGELPLEVQPLLLRVLQERTVTRVGESEARPVSVRVIAATNRNLEEDVAAGRFREDLFYRLRVVRLEVPPLRERPEDIEPLALHFARRAGAAELPPPLLLEFRNHSWPGNVRELMHAVEAYLVLGEFAPLTSRSLDRLEALVARDLNVERPYDELKKDVLERFQRAYLRALMAKTGGNISQAARISGLDRTYLGRLVRAMEHP